MVADNEFESLLGDIAKLSDSDQHDVWVPSLQKTVKFTSITVKQQKELLSSGVTPRMKDVAFVNCINKIIDTNCKEDVDITTIDRPIVILQLRSMSVSNNITLYSGGNEFVVDIDKHVESKKQIQIPDEAREFKVQTKSVAVECGAPSLSKDCILNDTFIERVGTDTKVDLTKSIGDIYVFELVKYIKTVSFNNEQLNVTVNFDDELTGDQMLQVFEALPMDLCNKMVIQIEKLKNFEDLQLTTDQIEPKSLIPIQADIFTGD